MNQFSVVFFFNTAVHEIVTNPPQEEFLAGVHLTMSAVSKSSYSKSQPESLPIEVPVSARPPTAGSGLSSPPVHGGTSPTASGPINMWATPRPVPQHPPHSPVRYRHESAGLQSSVAVHPQMSLTPSHGELSSVYVLLLTLGLCLKPTSMLQS